ncbi:hypothetical protein C7W93_15495 [Glaciimonas sp. PCH181]|nr:hypothetical protein C7W93_15495 [Glaciimonas sp. PCH181]
MEAMHKEIGFAAETDGATFADVIRNALSLYLKNRRNSNSEVVLIALVQHLSSEIRSQSLKIDVINSATSEIKQRLDDFETTT